MKSFIVKTNDKRYTLIAKDAQHAAKLAKMFVCKDDVTYRGFKIYKVDTDWEVKSSNGEMWNYDGRLTLQQVKAKLDKGIDKDIWDSIKDEASSREVIQQLIDDEASATAAYNIAIKNLTGLLDDMSIKVLKSIRDDEQRHSENLFAIMSGNVTEKNLEDCTKTYN